MGSQNDIDDQDEAVYIRLFHELVNEDCYDPTEPPRSPSRRDQGDASEEVPDFIPEPLPSTITGADDTLPFSNALGLSFSGAKAEDSVSSPQPEEDSVELIRSNELYMKKHFPTDGHLSVGEPRKHPAVQTGRAYVCTQGDCGPRGKVIWKDQGTEHNVQCHNHDVTQNSEDSSGPTAGPSKKHDRRPSQFN